MDEVWSMGKRKSMTSFLPILTMLFSHTNESPQRRKHTSQPTPLLPSSNSAITTNGHSDLESGDETQPHTSNGYTNETFNR